MVEVFVWIVVSLNHDWSEITGSEGTLYRFRMDLNLSPVEDELEGRKLTKDTKCNQCDYTSPWIGNLRRHMLTHSGERPCNQCNSRSCTQKFTKCLHCDFFSSHAGFLKKHIITHKGEKHHKCNQCSYMSENVCDFKRHMNKHSNDKSYKCNQCSFSSSWKTMRRNPSSVISVLLHHFNLAL